MILFFTARDQAKEKGAARSNTPSYAEPPWGGAPKRSVSSVPIIRF